MIGKLTGTLSDKNPPQVVVDCGGVGYEVHVPMSTFYNLPAAGEKVSLLTHFVVREDAQLLFGFLQPDERATFRQLIRISGVGPRTALAILSGLSVAELAQAIARQESGRLVKVPGIGKKTAERLCVELKEKLNPFLNNADGGKKTFSKSGGGPLEDAVAALIALGVKPPQAERAVLAAAHELGQDAAVEDLIRVGLKHRK